MTDKTFEENCKNLEIKDREGNMVLKQIPTFEELFPSLKGKIMAIEIGKQEQDDIGSPKNSGVRTSDIQNHCLDKQKVRDIIHKYCSSQLMLHNLEEEMLKEWGLEG